MRAFQPFRPLGGGSRTYASRIFDGENDRLEIPAINLTSALTVAAWVRVNSLDAGNGNPSIIDRWAWSANNRQWALSLEGNVWTAMVNKTGSVFTDRLVVFFGSPPVGSWRHVAMAYDGQTLRAYLSGVLSGSSSYGSPTALHDDATSKIWIGAARDGDNPLRFLAANIYDARLYNRALSQPEIALLAAKSHVGSGLEGWWVSDGSLADLSGAGNHAVDVGGSALSSAVP